MSASDDTAACEVPLRAPDADEPRPVVVFDGTCSLCDASVRWLTRRSAPGTFLFVPSQAKAGRDLLARHGIDAAAVDSLVLVERGRACLGSDAALGAAAHLRRPWRFLAVLRHVPRALREVVYRWIARRRHRLGRRDVTPS